MKKLKLIRKLTLNKQVIAPLNNDQASRILGGDDAPSYGTACTVQTCKTECNDNKTECLTMDTNVTDDQCRTHNTNPCNPGDSALCFTQAQCTQGNCSGTCPQTYGDATC
jgi:hypothetical protein